MDAFDPRLTPARPDLAAAHLKGVIPAERYVEPVASRVVEAVAQLSTEHRQVLYECYYQGRSVAETARRLGVPEGTVKSRTHYALRALRLALEEQGVTG